MLLASIAAEISRSALSSTVISDALMPKIVLIWLLPVSVTAPPATAIRVPTAIAPVSLKLLVALAASVPAANEPGIAMLLALNATVAEPSWPLMVRIPVVLSAALYTRRHVAIQGETAGVGQAEIGGDDIAERGDGIFGSGQIDCAGDPARTREDVGDDRAGCPLADRTSRCDVQRAASRANRRVAGQRDASRTAVHDDVAGDNGTGSANVDRAIGAGQQADSATLRSNAAADGNQG